MNYNSTHVHTEIIHTHTLHKHTLHTHTHWKRDSEDEKIEVRDIFCPTETVVEPSIQIFNDVDEYKLFLNFAPPNVHTFFECTQAGVCKQKETNDDGTHETRTQPSCIFVWGDVQVCLEPRGIYGIVGFVKRGATTTIIIIVIAAPIQSGHCAAENPNHYNGNVVVVV